MSDRYPLIDFSPLTRPEQDDLFRQMDKWLAQGGLRKIELLAPEAENMFRLRATVYHLRAQLRGAETTIRALEQEIEHLNNDRHPTNPA